MPRRRLTKKRHAVAQPLDPSYRLIPLTRGQVAIVDTEDFEWLSQWNWFADFRRTTRSYIAARNHPKVGTGPKILMHREILRARAHEQVDHENHDTLDNRKNNLRLCLPVENSRNRRLRRDSKTGFKGVSRYGNKWKAYISTKGRRQHLGTFNAPEDAARAYDAAAKQLYGDFAWLNFVHCVMPKDKLAPSINT